MMGPGHVELMDAGGAEGAGAAEGARGQEELKAPVSAVVLEREKGYGFTHSSKILVYTYMLIETHIHIQTSIFT